MGGDAAIVDRPNEPISEEVIVHQPAVANRAVQNLNFRVRS